MILCHNSVSFCEQTGSEIFTQSDFEIYSDFICFLSFNFRIYVRKFFTSKKMFLCASIYNACNAMYTSGSHSTLCRLQTGRRRSGASTAIAWQLITNCNVTPAVNSDMLGTYYITANNIMSRSWEL